MQSDLPNLQALESVLDASVDRIIQRIGKTIVVGTPLGLGKPNRLINALYRRARADSSIQLEIVTALSLDIPQSNHWLQDRLMGPILERLFGHAYPRLEYLVDLKRHQLPDNIKVCEFYFQSGAALGNSSMQRHYISSNYTHVARDLNDRGVNLLMQLVAGPQINAEGRPSYSLSCNPDVTLDLKKRLDASGRDYMAIGHQHSDLPFMHGDAVVEADFFDQVITEDPQQTLFAIPRGPVTLRDHAVGFHAAGLVADGGTLQIGIGSLSDALVHSLIMRHQSNPRYRTIAAELDPENPSIARQSEIFDEGLYGASEMFMDGFMHLYQAGILKREVFDDLERMRAANQGQELSDSGTGAVMDGGFFLGSKPFYDFLNNLNEQEQPRFRMHGVGRINQLYGGNEALEIEQRRHARFINTCMMMTATGAAVSDGLADYQMVSGVGGQYNFVAMAHAMEDGRSALMLRSVRENKGKLNSNIVWQYPQITIPRHLRDWVVTEYGVANLRGKSDEECIQAVLMLTDAGFQDELMAQAKAAGKLAPDWQIPAQALNNTEESLKQRLQPYIDQGDFPEYPFGSDFDETEHRLIHALQASKSLAASKIKLLTTALKGRPAEYPEELARIGLDQPKGLKEKFYARLIAGVMSQSN